MLWDSNLRATTAYSWMWSTQMRHTAFGTGPTFGILAQAVLSCLAWNNAGGYGCYWRMQCRLMHSVACVLFLINFYQWYQALLQSVLILLPYAIIIFKIQQYWVQWYAVMQFISRHDFNPFLTNAVQEIDCEITWNVCFLRLRLLYQASAHNAFYIIWWADLRRMSKCYSVHNKGQSWHLTDDHPCMVWINRIRDDAFYEHYLATN